MIYAAFTNSKYLLVEVYNVKCAVIFITIQNQWQHTRVCIETIQSVLAIARLLCSSPLC